MHDVQLNFHLRTTSAALKPRSGRVHKSGLYCMLTHAKPSRNLRAQTKETKVMRHFRRATLSRCASSSQSLRVQNRFCNLVSTTSLMALWWGTCNVKAVHVR